MKTIYDVIRNGQPLDFTPFIDVHGHFGPWTETTIPYCMDYGRVIGEMDRYGCDMAWISTSNPGYSDAMRVKNDYVFDFARDYPDRIIPYCTLSANEQAGCADELQRCLGLGRCIGVKMHIYHQQPYSLRDAFLQPVLELLNAHKLVYLNHAFLNLDDLRWAAETYPDITFMAGHMWLSFYKQFPAHTNIVNCTCAAMGPDMVADEVRHAGRSDIYLVGSDFPLMGLTFGIGMIAYGDLPEEDKRNILGLNAVRLLERTGWFERGMLRCTR